MIRVALQASDLPRSQDNSHRCKRKKYLEPNAEYRIPRTTQLFRKRRAGIAAPQTAAATVSISQDDSRECEVGTADAIDREVDNAGARDDVADDDRAADTGVMNYGTYDDGENNCGAGGTGSGPDDDDRADSHGAEDESIDHEFAAAVDDEITSDGDLEHFI